MRVDAGNCILAGATTHTHTDTDTVVRLVGAKTLSEWASKRVSE